MTRVVLRRPPIVRASAGWNKAWTFFTGPDRANRAPDILDGGSAQLTLTRVGLPAIAAIVLSTAGATLEIQGNAVSVALNKTVTGPWTLGLYDFEMLVFGPLDATIARWTVVSDELSRARVQP